MYSLNVVKFHWKNISIVSKLYTIMSCVLCALYLDKVNYMIASEIGKLEIYKLYYNRIISDNRIIL